MSKSCGGLLLTALLWASFGAYAAAAPSNDDFAAAQVLSGPLPIEVSGTNVGATIQGGEPGHSPMVAAGHTIWFRWEATNTEVVTVDTCGSDFPTILGVYFGNALGSLTEVAGNTWESFGCGFQEGSQATFKAIAGRTYSIQVDGNAYHEPSQPPVSREGAVQLQVRHRPPPANDDFVDAKTIQPDSFATSAPNFGATKEMGEPNHRGDEGGASVWFKFTAQRTGGVRIQMDGGSIGGEGLVAAYTGSSVDQLTPVSAIESWGDSNLAFPVVQGVTYRIAVDGKYAPSAETPFMDEPEIFISTFPGNDDFEDAFQIPSASFLGGSFGLFGLGSAGATKQPGEPDHAGNRGGASVWFSWTAPQTGSARLNACSASFHTLLAAYTGSTVAGLAPVAASSDPQGPSCQLFSQGPYELSFNVDVGTTYRIAVDGYEGAWGSFGLVMETSTSRLPLSQSGSPSRRRPPRTKIVRKRVGSRQRVAVFHLHSSEPDSSFLCKLDSHPFVRCHSTVVYKKLTPGRHTFKSKAVNSSSESDSTPAVFRFRIQRS